MKNKKILSVPARGHSAHITKKSLDRLDSLDTYLQYIENCVRTLGGFSQTALTPIRTYRKEVNMMWCFVYIKGGESA